MSSANGALQCDLTPKATPCVMAAKPVEALLDDVRLLSEQADVLLQALRSLTHETLGSITEEVKVGGMSIRMVSWKELARDGVTSSFVALLTSVPNIWPCI